MSKQRTDVQSGRLPEDELAVNFSDMHPPLSRPEALIEADRCYFCYDAPCTTACPTEIDIPRFIQNIRSDNITASARTILGANIMGGMCARVCPTEILCEEACVRNTHEDKPVNIGLLQRYATDPVIENGTQLFEAAEASGRTVAVVGGGPAGLSCAHRLALLGHRSVVYSKDSLAGGLNEYGIAAYKTVDDFAQREVDYILGIGGIELRTSEALGRDLGIADLLEQYDAVFLGIGLDDVNSMGLENEDIDGVEDAVDYIAELRQADDKSSLPVGRHVVVIGGGMTAIDIAVQSKFLGAEQVDIVYRRGPDDMGASPYEQAFAQTSGVNIRHWSSPRKINGDDRVTSMEFAVTEMRDGKLTETGETWTTDADVVFKAVGQRLDETLRKDGTMMPELQNGKLQIDANGATSVKGVWAGGDCAYGRDDLTVSAVQDGKLAAIAIDRWLRDKDDSDG